MFVAYSEAGFVSTNLSLIPVSRSQRPAIDAVAPFGNLFSNCGRAKLSAWTTSVSGAFPALRRALAARTARPSSEFAGYW